MYFYFVCGILTRYPVNPKKKGFQLPLAPSKRDAFEELFTPGSGGTCGWALISFISGVGHA